VADATDNCVNKANPDQADLDADGEATCATPTTMRTGSSTPATSARR